MSQEVVRVLHVTEMLQAAGIESFIMNVYRNIDRSKIQFDFFITRDEKEFYDDEIKELGGKKYTIDINKDKNVFIRVLQESYQLYKFLKKTKYKIVHIHSGTPLRVFYLFAAKFAGVDKRMYHSHSAEVKGPHSLLATKKIIFKILKRMFRYSATNYFACSKAASEWMYPPKLWQDVKVIYNGINIEKFKFNKQIREKYRNELDISDNYVIGHIGRFNEQKNHTFLIDIFNEIHKRDKKAKLLLIGEGELKEKIHEKVKKLCLDDSVIFLGVRHDVNNIMQAIDVFLLPSNYEGLPVVGVEAQASGLPTIVSDNITNEIKITDNIKMVSLSKLPSQWADIILNYKDKYDRKDMSIEITKSGYDISDTVKSITTYYLSC